MFKFVQQGNKFLVKYPNEEIRELIALEIDSFYDRINSVLDTLGLKVDYFKLKAESDISLIDYAIQEEIDLDACLYAVLSQFRLEKPLV